MKIYLGWVVVDYTMAAELVCIGLDKEKTQRIVNTYLSDEKWVQECECGLHEAIEHRW